MYMHIRTFSTLNIHNFYLSIPNKAIKKYKTILKRVPVCSDVLETERKSRSAGASTRENGSGSRRAIRPEALGVALT